MLVREGKTMAWEIDWSKGRNKQAKVWARNLTSRMRSAREWHWVEAGRLKTYGAPTPTYRKDSWEVDWSKRNEKLVWARNPLSKMPASQEWHWVDFHTLERAGIPWRPKIEKAGRYLDANGYINLTPRGMTAEEVSLADEHNLWRGKKRTRCPEHRLVAVKKFGRIPPGGVVRHLNGCKTDNSPENIALGTTQENTLDHDTARRMVIYWRNKYEEAEREIARLRALLD